MTLPEISLLYQLVLFSTPLAIVVEKPRGQHATSQFCHHVPCFSLIWMFSLFHCILWYTNAGNVNKTRECDILPLSLHLYLTMTLHSLCVKRIGLPLRFVCFLQTPWSPTGRLLRVLLHFSFSHKLTVSFQQAKNIIACDLYLPLNQHKFLSCR